MSLLPMHTVFPSIFLEARVQGVPSALISQIGLSIDAPEYSVAVFSKASGVLLVAGVGSYCAYRICTKYLGNRFYWMLLDRSAFDRIATADRRLLYGNHINLDCGEVVEVEDEEGDRRSEDDFRERMSVVSSQVGSRSSIFRRSTRARGLFAIRNGARSREGVLSRRTTSNAASEISSAASDVSANLRIVWEGEQTWEDEFATQDINNTPRHMMFTSTPYKSSQAASVGDMCSVFDEVMSVTSRLDHDADDILFQEEAASSVDEKSPFKNIKCFTDSSYMYHSVLDSSEMGSECGFSVKSGRSIMSNLRKKKVDKTPGLWTLSNEKPSTSSLQVRSENRMISSATSKRSSNMFDSAIGTSMTSSDDESVDFSRNRLSRVAEADALSLAPTEMSMEWFDDDGIRPSTNCDINAFDWDLDAPCGSKLGHDLISVAPAFAPTDYTDLMMFATEHFEQYSPQFKLMYHLYHKRKLKRIGGQSSETEGASNQIKQILSQALYHKHQIVSEDKLRQLEELASNTPWLTSWRPLDQLRSQLEALHELNKEPSSIRDVHLKGLQAALVLEAITVTQMADSSNEGSAHCDPRVLADKLDRDSTFNEAAWSLLSRLIDVSLEVIDVNSGQSSVGATPVRIGTSPDVLTWLKVGHTLLPLYTVPDD